VLVWTGGDWLSVEEGPRGHISDHFPLYLYLYLPGLNLNLNLHTLSYLPTTPPSPKPSPIPPLSSVMPLDLRLFTHPLLPLPLGLCVSERLPGGGVKGPSAGVDGRGLAHRGGGTGGDGVGRTR
jgi:hypothetical protein